MPETSRSVANPTSPLNRGLLERGPLKLGTRASPLAMAQACETRESLCAAQGWSLDAVEIVPVTASGDKILDRPLAEIGGKALWTKELDLWLYEREIDFAVHSLKDVETVRPDWLTIAAILPREDVRDALVGAASIAALPQGARVGTSAPRRAAQMLHLRPDLAIVPFRGNVATRLGKLASGEADATLLAMAGLNRLGQADVGVALDAESWLPAPGQGAIAIECRSDDAATRALLASIDHGDSHTAVLAERALLAGLGGTCHSAIAVLSEKRSDGWWLKASLFSPDGAQRTDGEARFTADNLSPVQALAGDLLARSPDSITRHFNPA